ncbi:MAG: hypothetical protein K8S62_12645 [Candidatus Sabulitectum sp.]|nr:hypothetical protein [Candidatus Sabulitectum sp.]
MKFLFIVLVMAVAAFAGNVQDNVGDYTGITSGPGGGAGGWDYPEAILFDNGPFVTGAGAGSGGADISELGSGESTYGFGFQFSTGNMMADQFEIPTGESWTIEGITTFGYQTGSGTSSTITGVYLSIWDDPPDTGTLVYGDQAVNVMTSTDWSNCYRVSNGQATNTDRPVMANVCEFTDLYLTEGEYWLVVQLNGSGSSGPWSNPVTITGQSSTGDAIQYTSTGWAPAVMGTSGGGIGLPFILDGFLGSALERSSWAGIKTSF